MDTVYQRCINPDAPPRAPLEDTSFVCPKCGGLLDVAYDWDRLQPPEALRRVRSKMGRTCQSAQLQRRVAVSRFAAVRSPRRIMTIGEGQTILQKADAVAGYVGMNPGCLFLQYEGMNPSGSFKDNGMTAAFTHARMVGARRAACASHRQHQRLPGGLLLRHRLDARNHFHRQRENIVWQTGAGARSRRPYGPDRRRFRRCHATRATGGAQARHLPGQQHQPVPPRRPENDHVPHPRGAALGGAGLDRRARRQPRQCQLLRQGVHRAGGVGPDQGPPRLAVITAAGANTFYQLYERFGLRWNGGTAGPASIIHGYYRGLDAEQIRARRPSPAPSRSITR